MSPVHTQARQTLTSLHKCRLGRSRKLVFQPVSTRKQTYGSSFDPVWLRPSRLYSSLLLSFYCRCLSFFFYLTKTLSVESARLYFAHRSIGEYIFQVLFPTVDTSMDDLCSALTTELRLTSCTGHPVNAATVGLLPGRDRLEDEFSTSSESTLVLARQCLSRLCVTLRRRPCHRWRSSAWCHGPCESCSADFPVLPLPVVNPMFYWPAVSASLPMFLSRIIISSVSVIVMVLIKVLLNPLPAALCCVHMCFLHSSLLSKIFTYDNLCPVRGRWPWGQRRWLEL